MALESQVSPSNTTLRPFMGGTTSDLTGTCSPLGSCTSACGPSRMALCTASCKALPAVFNPGLGKRGLHKQIGSSVQSRRFADTRLGSRQVHGPHSHCS